MHLLIIGLNFHPELTGIGKYTGELAASLAERHTVSVICAPPYYPHWRVEKPYRPWRYQKESWQGVAVQRVPLWVPQQPSGLKRLLHLASFALFTAPLLLQKRTPQPQVIITIAPTLMSTPGALFLAKRSGAKSWLHFQDFEVDAAFNLSLLPQGGWLQKIALYIEGHLLKRFDRISTISKKMHSVLLEKGVPERKALLFPNWVDTQQIYPLEGENILQQELGLASHQKIALYHGNMGKKQGLEILLQAAKKLADMPDLLFLIAGEGAVKAELQDKAHGMRNVRFIGLQPLEKLNELVNLADYHLLPQRAGVADLVMPSKLTTMLASGKPVIAGADAETELGQVLRQVGLLTPPEDAAALAEAIRSLYNDPARAKTLGEAGRQYALKHLEKEVVLANFEKNLKILAQEKDCTTEFTKYTEKKP